MWHSIFIRLSLGSFGKGRSNCAGYSRVSVRLAKRASCRLSTLTVALRFDKDIHSRPRLFDPPHRGIIGNICVEMCEHVLPSRAFLELLRGRARRFTRTRVCAPSSRARPTGGLHSMRAPRSQLPQPTRSGSRRLSPRTPATCFRARSLAAKIAGWSARSRFLETPRSVFPSLSIAAR